MDLHKLHEIFSGQPDYRLKQVEDLLFKQYISSWDEATNLSKTTRDALKTECPLDIVSQKTVCKDGDTQKALLVLSDGLNIESVLMKHKDGRNTVCVSSQVGCPMGCIFCATGKIGFERNLTAEEIIEQVLYFARILKKEGKRVTNIVFMGMGEPFLNYDNVIAAIRFLNDKDRFNIGSRHISISTVGIPEGMKKLANEPLQVNLAVSLHAPTDRLRSELIPANLKIDISKIMEAAASYAHKTNRRVMFEYMLIDKLNDTRQSVEELVDLFKKSGNKLFFVNLIAYNPTGKFKSSQPKRVLEFQRQLQRSRIGVTVRHRFGEDIDAACGQLANKREKV